MSPVILVAGSANLDFVVRAQNIPAPGETVLGRDFQTFPGGKGANQAVACARAGGVTTHMLAAFGQDAFAAPIEASLRDAQVNVHSVLSDQLPTGTAFICVSNTGENAITVAPGANSELGPGHLPALDGFTHLLMQLEIPLDTVLAYAMQAKAAGLQVVLNAAPARQLPPQLFAAIDVLIVNEVELAQLSAPGQTVAQNLESLAVPTVVVTLGAQGCCARHNGKLHFQSGLHIQPVDTTAAGDTFCGAFTAAMASGQAVEQALQFATAASALACLKPGAQSSIPDRLEVETFMSQNPQPNHSQNP
jgi:ribokinase